MKKPKSEARRAENACLRQRFLFAALGPRAARPLEPRQGVPPAPQSQERLRRPPGAFATWQGCRGKSTPTPCRQLGGRFGRVKGPCPRPCGAAGRTNPLTRPALEKPPQARAGAGWRCWSGWGSRLAQRPRSGPGLDAQERPHAPGWWLGCFSPSRLPRGERPGGPSETILLLSLWVSATPERQRAGREAKRRGSNSPEGSYTLFLAASRAATGFRRKLICGALASLRGVWGA